MTSFSAQYLSEALDKCLAPYQSLDETSSIKANAGDESADAEHQDTAVLNAIESSPVLPLVQPETPLEEESPARNSQLAGDKPETEASPQNGASAKGDDPLRIQAGASMSNLGRDAVEPLSYTTCPAELFNLRVGPNYKKTGSKAPSPPSLYELVACDVFQNEYDDETKISHVVREVQLPDASREFYDPECPLPRVIVCNAQVISKPPKLFGKPDPDVGYSLVHYFVIKKDTMYAALGRCEDDQRSAAVKLLVKFVNEWGSNPDMKRRFKAMGMVGNVEEIGLPRMLQGSINTYNGKPAIINKAGKLYNGHQDGDRLNSYLEVDIMIDKFAMLAQKLLCSMQGSIQKMVLRPGFVIQGESDDELPECLIGCSELNNLDFQLAAKVSFPPISANPLHRSKTMT